MEAAAIASRRGSLLKLSVENDQAKFASSCNPKSVLRGMDADAIADIKGASLHLRGATAHAVFAKCCA